MEKKVFDTKGEPEKLKKKLSFVSILSFVAGIIAILLYDSHGISDEKILSVALCVVFLIIGIIVHFVKKNLDNAEIKIFDSHIERIHCGVLLKKKLYLKYNQINDVQYFLNPITSGIRITTSNVKYDILVDRAEEACDIIRNKINNVD